MKKAIGILRRIQYATLATVSADGQPWNSPVRVVVDDELNLYWFSDKENQHSRNVRANGLVFIVVYDSTVPEGEGAGVYVRARVSELADPGQIRLARRLKKGQAAGDPARFMGEAVRRVYRARPLQIWTNGTEWKDGRFVRDYRVELSVAGLRRVWRMRPDVR
ncbi:MAG: pyridoxamine 5-phosphate oxidase-like protein FMN-binding protein [Patescibacteria group bacterium]|nr:pyridoxamine 5-phosphate oxidase-like protein FMN-binding protein [Patescibacteria group bacterium]